MMEEILIIVCVASSYCNMASWSRASSGKFVSGQLVVKVYYSIYQRLSSCEVLTWESHAYLGRSQPHGFTDAINSPEKLLDPTAVKTLIEMDLARRTRPNEVPGICTGGRERVPPSQAKAMDFRQFAPGCFVFGAATE